MNKFDQIKLETLIKFIQEDTEKMMLPENKKKMSSSTLTKKMKDIRDMKHSVMGRLGKMDRHKPEFFPIGSRVDYTAPYGSQKGPLPATVKRWEGWGVWIKLDSEEYEIKVEPIHLLLKYIRINY